MDIFSNMKTIENKVGEYSKRNKSIEKNDKIIIKYRATENEAKARENLT